MIRCLKDGFELTVAHLHSPTFIHKYTFMEDDADGTAFCLCPNCGAELESTEAPHARPNTWLEREDPKGLAGLAQSERLNAIEPPSVVLSDAPLGDGADEPFRLKVEYDGEIRIVPAEDNPFEAVVVTTWKPGMGNALKSLNGRKGKRSAPDTVSGAKQPAPASTPPTEAVSAPASAPGKTLDWSDLV